MVFDLYLWTFNELFYWMNLTVQYLSSISLTGDITLFARDLP